MQPSPPSLLAVLPFAGLLATTALLPLIAPRVWHRRMGLITAFWCAALVVPMAVLGGAQAAAELVWHALLVEYLPFIALLLALFTVGGGIFVSGGPWGRPAGNVALLALGTALAGVMGATGASLVMIHPLLRANAHRAQKVHLVVFFIVLVSNAGGALSPLGPPLYMGFFQGVPFFWPLIHLAGPLLLLAGLVLAVFWLIDRHLAGGEPPPRQPLRLRGWRNVALLGVVVPVVLAQGIWQPGSLTIAGTTIGIELLAGIILFMAVAGLSAAITPRAIRRENMFAWRPMWEVAVLFAGIFITITPVLSLLAAGPEGPAGGLLALAADAQGRPAPLAYFWLSGILSAFLDNAPTYLIFFKMAGNDAAALTGPMAPVLQALSAGSVFFGALTYIGNAPNLMVASIAAHRGVRMPGFFGYMLWSCALLLPIFLLQSLLFFR